MDNEFLLQDRIQKIQQIIENYGIDNFYLSLSGGKDSTVLHYLIDEALPNNNIPRLFVNTGIEYNDIVLHVKSIAQNDSRINIINAGVNLREMWEEHGYPFKSKEHSDYVRVYQSCGISKTSDRYLNPSEEREKYGCRDDLKYQFTPEFKLKISSRCCKILKKDTCKKWSKEHNKKYALVGVRQNEGGVRRGSSCLVFKGKSLTKFQPLFPVDNKFIDWYIDTRNIKLCKLYYPPFNMKRTGCKGCPYNIRLQKDLEMMKKYLPDEYKQCEMLWKPVYDEYRRIGYRLKKEV